MSYLEIATGALARQTPTPGHLFEIAGELAPKVYFTVWETEDVEGDIAWLGRVKALIDEYPGGNKVYMRLRTLDGDTHYLEWRALAVKGFTERLDELIGERDETTYRMERRLIREARNRVRRMLRTPAG